MNGQLFALTLCLINPPPGAVDGVQPRACYELGVYSKVECEIHARSVRVETKARLTCPPRELSPDEARAFRLLSQAPRPELGKSVVRR